MKTIQFKTNIKCGGCVATATPYLDNVAGASKWKVDTTVADKILTVQDDLIPTDEIIAAVNKAGFTAEVVK